MSARPAPLVVIGLGNTLLRDDGVGVRLVESLRRLAEAAPRLLPEGTRLVDGGTLDIDLLRYADGARALLLVDAVDLERAPGTATVLHGDEIDVRTSATRAGGVGDLLATGRLLGWLPDHVALLGIQVASVGFGEGLSAAVEAGLPAALDQALLELQALDDASAMVPA